MPEWQVNLTPRALADSKQLISNLVDVAGFITAERYTQRIADVLDLLGTFPEAGTPRPEYGKGIRAKVIAPFVLFYVIENDRVDVLRILHGKRNITRDLVQE